jgi:hypothetical protein
MEMAMIYPFSATLEQQDLTPLEGGRGVATATASINLGKIRAFLFWRDKGMLERGDQNGPEVPTGRPSWLHFLPVKYLLCISLTHLASRRS